MPQVILVGGRVDNGWFSIRRYGEELLAGLQAGGPARGIQPRLFVPTPTPLASWLSLLGPLGRRAASYGDRFLFAPRQIPRAPGAIHHLLDQSLSYLVRWLDPARTVVTCHDLLHFPLWKRRRTLSPWPWATDQLYRTCVGGLRRCAAVVAVSEKTRQDAVRYLGCDPARIRVIHEGVSPVFRMTPHPNRLEEVKRALALPEGILLLHVGVVAFYKNLEGLFQGLGLLRKKFRKPFTLLRVGPRLLPAQRRLASRLGLTGQIRELGVRPDEEIACLYRLADLLVQPSLYEGFGLPPIEAMAAGLPVVASDRGALPEILGEAALLVNPEDPEAIASAVQRLLEEPNLRETLRSRGLKRCDRFRWEEAAEQMIALYQHLG